MNDLRRAPFLPRFRAQRVFVVGDAMLDEYLWGTVGRISPEAPVPVVECTDRTFRPGGAANTAANVAGLHATASLLSIVGADESGRQLLRCLADLGIHTDGILLDDTRPTTTKTRILAGNPTHPVRSGQQMLRLDRESRAPFPASLEARLLRHLDERLPDVDCCILSDYGKGLGSPTLCRYLLQRATALGKPVVVDPKGADFSKYRGATVVKPNLHEASLFLRHPVRSAEEVLEAGRRLLDTLAPSAVLLTRGAEGMSLFTPGAEPVHIPAQAREVFDVTGAGDTVAATLGVALAAGASLEQSARLASRAAGITVGRVGTAAVQLSDLLGGE